MSSLAAANKDVALAFLAAFSRGDVAGLADMMTPDAVWWVSGDVPGLSGTNSKDSMLEVIASVRPMYERGSLHIIPKGVTAEGDRVAVEAECAEMLTDGRIYRNWFHFMFVVRDGRIETVKEYIDTKTVVETFFPPAD